MKPKELTKLRKQAGLTMTALAELLKVAVNTVSQWESGARPISASRADHIRSKLKERAA